MRAILTKYIGPTDHRGARVKARAFGASIIVPWDYEHGAENHARAALALIFKMGWTRPGEDSRDIPDRFHVGALPDGTGYAFIWKGPEKTR